MKIPAFHKLSTSQQRDFDAYTKIGISSTSLITPNTDHIAFSKEEFYFLWDTHGIISNNPEYFNLIQAKANLNLTIKMWVEDISNELLFVWEVWDYCNEFPLWVWNSFCQQLKKQHLIWSFMQVHYAPDNKTYWPSYYLSFNPCI